MNWNTFHDRGEILRDVVHVADERRDGTLPMGVPGVAENFTDELDLVGALLLKWHARLSGNVERSLAHEPMDLESAVASAWLTTAKQMPGVRLVIDRCIEHPTGPEMERSVIRAREHEWVGLAIAAGLANGEGAAAVAAGRRVEELARAGYAAPATPVVEHVVEPATEPATEPAIERAESLADRIKAVLAA
jgi:hypothetical protein